jgi:nucleoside-diphosphate-sugar epimerase
MTVTHEPLGAIGITGTGFIGTAAALRWRSAGHPVRGVDLAPDPSGRWEAAGASTISGDISDPATMAGFCDGLDTVLHTAALVAESGDLEVFRRVNVEGTRVVAEAARAAGVRRFVHLSSVMVYGFDYPDGVSEDGPLDGADNPYCITKIESEAVVADLHDPGTFDVFTIRPGDVYGPGSIPWVVRPYEAMAAGMWVDIGGELEPLINHVFVDNLLDGIEVVLDAGASGEPFVVTDRQRTTTAEFYAHLLAEAGIDPAAVPRISAADAVAFGLNPEAVRYLTRRGVYSADRVAALGYAPAIGLAEGMARTRAWLASGER